MVDEALAQLSNNLTYSAIAVSVLALVMYAAELASARARVVGPPRLGRCHTRQRRPSEHP